MIQFAKRLYETKRKKVEIVSTQDTLNFKKIYPSGIMQLDGEHYSKMVRFSDISYQLSKDEEKKRIFSLYCSLLNSFDSSVGFQFCFINSKVESKEETTEAKEKSFKENHFEMLREEYFNFLEAQRAKGSNGIIRNKYLIFTIREKTYKGALRRLENIEQNIRDSFRTLGAAIESIDGVDRVSILNFVLNDATHYIDIESLNAQEMKKYDIKDLIAPSSIDFSKDKNSFEMGERFGTTMYFSITATELSDRVLVDFLDLEKEMIVSLHIRAVDQQKAIKMVKAKSSDLDSIKIEEQQKSIQRGYDMDILPTDLNMNIDEAKRILQDLQRDNERYFYLTFTVTILEENRKSLENSIFTLKMLAQKHNCELIPMTYQQEKAFLSALPFGNNINEAELERGLTTSATAVFVPFTTKELYQEDKEATYYGLNSLSNNMIQFNRKKLKNPNGLFLGTPGSGKSFSAKREMIDTFLKTTDDILICDPEGEYYPFVELLQGEIINISLNSKEYINPLDITMEYGEGENPISYKSDFVITLMNVIVGIRSGLTAKQRTMTDKAVRVIYRKFMESGSSEDIPLLEDLYNELRNYEDKEAADLADALELYVHGSLNIFNHKTSINPKNRLVCFNIQQLGSNLKDLGMLVLQDYVWNKVTANRMKSKKTWYYMDKFHKLLAEEQTSNYSVEFWKRFRKWGGIPTGITQNVKDLLSSPKIETILENSEFVYLLNQASDDRRILQQKLDISDYQATHITNSSEGEGLLVCSGIILPFRDRFPKNNHLYPAMTTKPEEIKKLRRHQEKH